MMSTSCIGCGAEISDRFFMTVLDQAWHSHCVQCADCGEKLIDSCYTRDKKLYCKSDFFKRFATQCGVCKKDLSPSDLVRRALDRVYHLHCFTCLVCRRQLDTGEEYFVLDNTRFMCKKDYLEIEGDDSSDERANSEGECDLEPSRGVSTPAAPPAEPKPKPKQPKSPKSPRSKTPLKSVDSDISEADKADGKAGGEGGDGGSKKSRPRTNIKEDQLKILHAAFVATPLPSKEEREELVMKTGLPMRVIQVWFQNKRSKERKLQKETGSTPPASAKNPPSEDSASQSSKPSTEGPNCDAKRDRESSDAPGKSSSSPANHSPSDPQKSSENSGQNKTNGLNGETPPSDLSAKGDASSTPEAKSQSTESQKGDATGSGNSRSSEEAMETESAS